ncbi:MAG: CvpA family protein [Spirochaetales bacterium]|nr:CvpA family protein [Spirochaetales bacterium]
MTIAPFDLVCLLIIVLLVIKVTLTGFIAEFFSRAAILIGLMGGILFFRTLEPYAARILGPGVFAAPASFLSIFLVLYLAIKLLQQLAGNAFEGETMANLDRALGFFLGFAEGVLLVMMVLSLMTMQPWFDVSSLLEGSLFARLLLPFVQEGRSAISGFLPA